MAAGGAAHYSGSRAAPAGGNGGGGEGDDEEIKDSVDGNEPRDAETGGGCADGGGLGDVTAARARILIAFAGDGTA
eukprot:4412302-Pleurochrysis_carterae.AAC.1